jgi:putative redox protein
MASQAKRSAPAEARWEGGYRADVTVREFRFVVDEPADIGGENAGAMPTEYLLVAIASCYAMALAHVARKRGLALTPLTVRAVATYDGPSFGTIDIEVEFDGGPPAGVDELVERASRVCYVSNTLARSPRVSVTVSGR